MIRARHQLMGCVGAALAALVGGCFPDYSYAPGGSDGAVVEDMVLVTSGGPFQLSTIRDDGTEPGTTSVTFSRSFSIDRYEVTVGRFRAWIDAGRPLPAVGTQLDPGGPYAMTWDAGWDAAEHGFGPGECYKPVNESSPNTWDRAQTDGIGTYPMTCVSWYEAVAFCHWDQGKRLPTHAEWVFIATGGSSQNLYPWGGEQAPTDCGVSIFNDPSSPLCDFPTRVGTAAQGRTATGVYDLAGSVFEWVWDVDWAQPGSPPVPANAADYAGPDPLEPVRRIRKGGAYIVPEYAGDRRLENFTFESFAPEEFFGDAGFRCARTETTP